MVARQSAGVLLFRTTGSGVEVLLGHMGGPFWARRDEGAWSVPKGEPNPDEELVDAARREFAEELGLDLPAGSLLDLGSVRQAGGKTVSVWALEADLDPASVVSNTFLLEWPRASGRMQEFPELDRAAWFDLAVARGKLVKGQVPFLDRLAVRLG